MIRSLYIANLSLEKAYGRVPYKFIYLKYTLAKSSTTETRIQS